jgi:hypothetical protein
MDYRVCTHKDTQITTSAKWFWLWCASYPISLKPLKAIIPTLLNHPVYVSYWEFRQTWQCAVQYELYPVAGGDGDQCCAVQWMILLITSAFCFPFFLYIHFRNWRTCFKVFAFLTIFLRTTQPLVVIAFWKFSKKSQRIMGLWKRNSKN